jgi:hypothetical protein
MARQLLRKSLWRHLEPNRLVTGITTAVEALIIRLPILIGVFVAALGLAASALNAGNAPSLRGRLPSVDNPYCAITTYLLPDFPEQATSMLDSNGRPVVVVNSTILEQSPAYGHFLMAHECCHHTLGHVRHFYDGFGHLGPQPFYYIRPALKHMELDADTCAVKMLKATHEPDAIEAARQMMLHFGDQPTGAYYPTGNERADNIARRAAEE